MEQRTILITGAGSGFGKGAAVELATRGHSVIAATETQEQADALAAEHPELTTMKLDVTSSDDIARVPALDVDVLINNAGLGGEVPLVDMTDEQWNVVIDVTLNGTFRMTRAMLQHMQPRGAGVIVNNASVLGWRAQKEQAHYAAAKAGVMALTRCAAMEAAEHGVRINAVSPSIAMHAFLNKVTSEEVLDELVSREAFGRAAEVWEIANVMVFLASDYSSYMTGEVVSVSSQHA